MNSLRTIAYEVTGRIARIQLNRPERGNGITLEMPAEIARCVEEANLDPGVHLIALSGKGKGFCGGYDLVLSAEHKTSGDASSAGWPTGSAMDTEVQFANHNPSGTWDPMLDYAMMSRNILGFISLFHSDKTLVGQG